MSDTHKQDAQRLDPPSASHGDTARAIAKTAVGLIPVAGGIAAEVFDYLITAPVEDRRQAWMKSVAEKLRQLDESSKVRLEDLQKDPAFTSTLLQASRAALNTHHEEKLEALRNAVVNTALQRNPDETRRQVFIRWIDQLTPMHLQILRLFANPKKWFAAAGKAPPNFSLGGLSDVLHAAYPELASQSILYEWVVRDLHKEGLLKVETLSTTMSGSGLLAERAGALGAELIDFITSHDSET